MDLFQIDDDGRLFISPAIENWESLAAYNIDTVIDLEGGLDTCIPSIVNQCRTYRSDFQLYGRLRDGYLRLRRGQVAQ